MVSNLKQWPDVGMRTNAHTNSKWRIPFFFFVLPFHFKGRKQRFAYFSSSDIYIYIFILKIFFCFFPTSGDNQVGGKNVKSFF